MGSFQSSRQESMQSPFQSPDVQADGLHQSSVGSELDAIPESTPFDLSLARYVIDQKIGKDVLRLHPSAACWSCLLWQSLSCGERRQQRGCARALWRSSMLIFDAKPSPWTTSHDRFLMGDGDEADRRRNNSFKLIPHIVQVGEGCSSRVNARSMSVQFTVPTRCCCL